MSPMALLFVALFNSILGLSILFPILAPLGRQLGMTELQIGLLSAGYALMQFLMSPYWGRRSEKIGRKPVLIRGILGFSASFFAFAIVAELGLAHVLRGWHIFALLLATRVIGGIFASATIPTAQAYVADITGRSDRTAGMAVMGAAFGLGVIFGPAIGAGLGQISLLTPVYFSAGVALLNALFVRIRLPEPDKHVHVERPRALGPVARTVWPLLGVAIAANLASIAMEQTVAFYFQDRLGLSGHGTAMAVGEALVVYGLVAVFVQGYVVRRYRIAAPTLLRVGLPIALVGFVLFIFAHGFWVLTTALAVQGLGQGLALPGLTGGLSLAVGDHEQGAVAGLNGSAQALGRLLGPVVGTGLYELRPELPYAFSAVTLVLAIGFLAVSGPLLAGTAQGPAVPEAEPQSGE